MNQRRVRLGLACSALALVLTAAGVSNSRRFSFDFAQYKGQPRPEAQDEFRFVIVGDRTGGAQWGVMPQVFREINHLDPDFVISVGDLIDGYGDDEETVSGIWEEFDKTEMPSLKVPFVYMPGNHDIFNAVSQKVYEKRYGPRFKSFNYRGLHFIMLNTQEAAGTDYRFRGRGADALGQEQIEWLKDDIARNRDARRILIFMHQPSWSALEPIYPLLEGLPVNIFAGHYHKYSYEEIRGIPHIICSATAAFIPEEGQEAYGRFRSYLLATVRDDDLKLALIRLGGVMSPKQIMEKDQIGIRQLADATAILRYERDSNAEVLFRNPMPKPVRLQIVRSSRGTSKYLFDGDEPQVEAGSVLRRSVDWGAFVGRSSAEYRVLYRFQNAGDESQTIDFPIEAKLHRSTQAVAVSSPPKIDGDLSEWSGARWQEIGDVSQASIGADAWQGPQDLSAQFAVAEDDNNIYLAVRVQDDTVAFNKSPFESDSIEIYTANAQGREISFNREDDWRGLIFAPFAGSGEEDAGPSSGPTRIRRISTPGIWGGRPPTQEFVEGQAAYVRDIDSRHYSIEIALPRSAIRWESEGVKALDITINDRDNGAGRETQLSWAGTDRNAYSSRYYGQIRLSK